MKTFNRMIRALVLSSAVSVLLACGGSDGAVDTPVTITADGLFENGHVLHADGDLVHVASEKGYLVKRDGQGTLRVRTLEAGNHDFACTSTASKNAPFVGKLVLTPPAN